MIKSTVVISLLLLFFLSSCAETGMVRNGGLDALKQRADAFWQARVEGDLIKAYQFESAKLTGKPTLQQYIRKSSILYRKAVIMGVQQQGDAEALVSVQIEYQIPAFMSKPLHSLLEDRWVLKDGEWLREVPEKSR